MWICEGYELVQSNKTPDEPEASRRIPSCQDDLSQEHMRNNETLVTQPSSSAITSVTYSANSVTSFVSDNSSSEMTSSKGGWVGVRVCVCVCVCTCGHFLCFKCFILM